ncbi:hypothetical protein EGW08_022094 [Elysia chlorotica]|uniref:Claudin n=1 Tax=Elysia chlorotica TaxID=188477 RepID=A0A433SLS1_ELYCH|nr:hypothetical protein EGW08_022094 [Elysia chlorotica]
MSFKPLILIAAGVLALGNLLHIIGLATTEWITTMVATSVGTYEVTIGLFRGCAQNICADLEDVPDWLKACKAMAILGMLVGLGVLALTGYILALRLMNKEIPRLLGILSLLGAVMSCVMILICVIVFAEEAKDMMKNRGIDDHDFGYSFALSIAGALIILIGGCIAFAASR